MHAQTELSGNWRAGATSFEVTIESWGGDCGTRPQSSRSNGGGLVQIEQKDQLLILHGRDQDIRTDACWSRNPAMKRTVASYSNGLWTMRCRTADNDPRAEQGTYTLKQTDPNTLVYQDVSRMDWSLNESKCVVTFNTLQTLTRATGGKVATRPGQTPVATPAVTATPESRTPQRTEPEPLATTRACLPGSAAKISVRPRTSEIEPGQRVCFRARVADAADCVLPNAQVDWALTQGKGPRLSGNCFTAADSLSEGAGEFHITARHSQLSAEALVIVRKLDLSALIATRADPGLTGFDDEEDVQVEATSKSAARVETRNAAPEISPTRRYLMFGLAAFALALTGLGVWVSRKKSAAVSGTPSTTPPPEPSVLKAREAATNAHPSTPAKPESDAPNAPWICPSCRIGYPAQMTTCPKDGTALIPYVEYAQRGKRADLEHAKRCPTCGKTYPASASFCGNDGASLVTTGR